MKKAQYLLSSFKSTKVELCVMVFFHGDLEFRKAGVTLANMCQDTDRFEKCRTLLKRKGNFKHGWVQTAKSRMRTDCTHEEYE